ncbi:hypothetical protein [Arthrobacter sp. zg-Y844]|uniref:hypothetical protein n=1 Tax=Arthrobacter sp. zg-Y844 TaxID=2964612 RepID=UPI002107AA7B|nr:hypothetical protein [Arthrobacter sp. zg-Y844]MCQ1987877.1 hypothetical protein [Arthrobacter sp. zg-Y844]
MDPELIFAADADAFGAGRRSLALRCRAGELIRLRAGVYVRADAWQQLPLWEQNRVRVRATVEQVPGHRVLIQQSAAAIWGFPLIGASPEVLLLGSSTSHGRRRGALRWTERRLLEPLETFDGMLLTSRAQTVLDMAAYLDFERAVPAMDHVLRRDAARNMPAVSKELLCDLARKLPVRTKQAKARRVIDFGDSRSESAGESYSRAVLHRLGFPAPELQQEFSTPVGRFRSDFYWKDQMLVGEFDGAVKYGANGSALSPSWETLAREKRREDAIRATGVGFVRWSWSDIGRPPEHPESLVRRMIHAGLPRIGRLH